MKREMRYFGMGYLGSSINERVFLKYEGVSFRFEEQHLMSLKCFVGVCC